MVPVTRSGDNVPISRLCAWRPLDRDRFQTQRSYAQERGWIVESLPVTYRPAPGQGRRTPIVDTSACRQADGASRTARPLGNSKATRTTASVPQQMLYADWNSVRLSPSPSSVTTDSDRWAAVAKHPSCIASIVTLDGPLLTAHQGCLSISQNLLAGVHRTLTIWRFRIARPGPVACRVTPFVDIYRPS